MVGRPKGSSAPRRLSIATKAKLHAKKRLKKRKIYKKNITKKMKKE